PQMLGVRTPMDLNALPLIDHVVAHLGDTRWPALLISALTLAAMLLGPRYARRFPFALVMIVLASAATGLLEPNIPTLSEATFVIPQLPALPGQDVAQFVGSVFVLFSLATMETLLSTSADEEREPGTQNDLDHELIGHGV